MYAKETHTGETANTMTIIYDKKQKIRKRPAQRIKRIVQRAKRFFPSHWYDDLLDGFEIDLTEFK